MSSIQRTLRHCIVAAAALITAGCAESFGPGESQARMEVFSGDEQATLPGGQIPRPLVVRVLDSTGAPASGVLVRWTTESGSSFESDTSRTDADGKAMAVWTIGTTIATYTASARADIAGSVSFRGHVDPASLIVTAEPETLRFSALGDTATVRLRVRSTRFTLDTLIDNVGASWHSSGAVEAVQTNTRRRIFRSVRNGSSWQWVFFGTNTMAPFFARVQQVPVDVRIGAAGSTQPIGDTLKIGPDTATQLAVTAVDAKGRAIEGQSFTNITWESSNPAVVSVTAGGSVKGIGDGIATLTARYGTSSETRVPVRVWSLRPVSMVAAGSTTCALLASSEHLACWGFREVGNASQLNVALVPEERPDMVFKALSMSSASVCGLTSAGAAWCWGRNAYGQIGNGTYLPVYPSYQASPVPVSGDITFSSITTGVIRTCGLTSDGTAWCWGQGLEGALGDGGYGAPSCGAKSTCSTVPKKVVGDLKFTTLVLGDMHTCGLTAEGRAFCWGSNRYGQLGSEQVKCQGYPNAAATTSFWCSTVPVEVQGGHRFKSISAGQLYTCGVTTQGALHCWGSNFMGVIGSADINEGFTAVYPAPYPVAPETRFNSVFAGYGHACAIDVDGAAWCWGSGFVGQLGNGGTGASKCTNGGCERAPVRVSGNLKFKSIAAGGSHTCGLTTDDVAYCWGWGGSGALGTGATANQLTPTRVAFQRR